MGIGDWFGQSATPDERLDVLDRTIMNRRLVPDYENQELDRFVVTDNDGRLHWRSLPNPVADLTQLRYTVAVPGRTLLEVSDASGKRLEVLEEAVREVGTYTHDWTTTHLAPGTYHCTLYLNDSFVVKKAVKVAR